VNTNLELYAPKYIFDEINNHKDFILNRTNFSDLEFEEFMGVLTARLKIIQESDFDSFKENARLICPDEDDILYFALAMALKCPIWSNDKLLKQQDKVKIYFTEEITKFLE